MEKKRSKYNFQKLHIQKFHSTVTDKANKILGRVKKSWEPSLEKNSFIIRDYKIITKIIRV